MGAQIGGKIMVAHIAATLLDGQCNFMTGEFVSLSGGWTSA